MQGDSALGRILGLVRDLRKRCAWDAAQTPETLRPYLVEEVLELDHAIARGDADDLRDELGDLLLHLAFQIVIGEERQQLDAEAVARTLEEKMRRRHPHLFDLGERPSTWELGKRETGTEKRGVLDGLPATLPPLLMAYRLQERAAGVGFDWPDAKGPLDQVKEEIRELEGEAGSGKRETIEDEVGDLLFAVVNLSRKLNVDPRTALEQANDKFQRRFAGMERLAEERGLEIGRASLEELDKLWEEVKATAGDGVQGPQGHSL